ncbi:hypothetical protein WKV44_04820 [Spirochaetia bacterium 38H-sp]|uniref:Protein kinase domain-containing protein n=1 Tax=Rarispira pelagica TaxID=3141764 RepID=A0ABU9UB23_9SPIR
MSRRRKSHQKYRGNTSEKRDTKNNKDNFAVLDSKKVDDRDKEVKTSNTKKTIPSLTCSVCGELIYDVYTTIAHKDSGEPIHFECAVNMIKQTETLGKDEELCYLGNGAFGIVIMKQPPSPVRFFIKKRIEFEPKDKGAWKKDISVNLVLDTES